MADKREKRVSVKVRTAKIVLAVIAVVAVIALAIFLANWLEKRADVAPEGAGTAASQTTVRQEDQTDADPEDMYSDGEDVTMTYNGQSYVYNDELTTLLIMGIDDYELAESASARNTSQVDFLLVAVFDDEAKTCTLLQINRDTMANVPAYDAFGSYMGVYYEQIALAHTYGSGLEDSCEHTVDAVSDFLYGVEIGNYISLTMDAVPVLNDLVGGVTVTIEDDFTGVDDALVMGETVTLMGEHALNFVRSRSSMSDDSTNLRRMERQRTYMLALTESLRQAVVEDDTFVIEAWAAIAGYMVTDCSVDDMATYGEQLTEYTLTGIVTPEGESVQGETYMEYYVDEAALQELVVELFYEPVSETE